MKALITGGAGFIGHYLVGELLRKGNSVKVLDNFSKGGSRNLEEFVPNPNFEFAEGDLTDEKITRKTAEDAGIIYHLAAKIGGIGYFHKIPASLLRDNLKMTMNVFETARNKAIKVVYISSSMVYEGIREFPSSEESLKRCSLPSTSYGFSKLSGEYIARAYNQEFGIPFVIIRPFNAYGPGDTPGDYVGYSHVIPDLVKKILNERNGAIEILGSGNQTRCFTYAEDIASGIALLGEKATDDDFNIGTSEEIRIDALAKKIWKIMGKNGEPELRHIDSYTNDVLRRVPDCSKVNGYGWKPTTPLDKGLEITVNWLVKRIKNPCN